MPNKQQGKKRNAIAGFPGWQDNHPLQTSCCNWCLESPALEKCGVHQFSARMLGCSVLIGGVFARGGCSHVQVEHQDTRISVGNPSFAICLFSFPSSGIQQKMGMEKFLHGVKFFLKERGKISLLVCWDVPLWTTESAGLPTHGAISLPRAEPQQLWYCWLVISDKIIKVYDIAWN